MSLIDRIFGVFNSPLEEQEDEKRFKAMMASQRERNEVANNTFHCYLPLSYIAAIDKFTDSGMFIEFDYKANGVPIHIKITNGKFELRPEQLEALKEEGNG